MPTKHDYHWTFGDKCHIRFPGGGDPVVDSPHGFNAQEGCASISDSNGNLLFYTDGRVLYDANHVAIPSPPLGGTPSSTHSAIIVPPAGGGSLYHIFTTPDWDGTNSPNVGPLTYTAVSVAGSVSIVSGPTKLTTFGPQRSAEALAAVPHRDCGKYWVVSMDARLPPAPTNAPPQPGGFFVMLIDSDAGPAAANTSGWPAFSNGGGYMKFSPDGSLLAVAYHISGVTLFNFDRATGVLFPHSAVNTPPNMNAPYGVEFSPNGRYLYFSGYRGGYIRRVTIGGTGTPPIPFTSTDLVGQWTTNGRQNFRVGALQLAPNGKIYGTKVSQNTLFEIGDPDNPTLPATPASVQFKPVATQADGTPLTFGTTADLGLPTFARIPADCDTYCRDVAHEVEVLLDQRGLDMMNRMVTCQGETVEDSLCASLDVPPIAPWTAISWGNSACDCIEGDDTEVMQLRICNPYRNLTLANLTVQKLEVVDSAGQPVPNLPTGAPSIQLVPVGPYCFDDLPPCACVNREFVLRLRGAPGGTYRILVRGICFDVRFHGDTDACFAFEVCPD